MKKSQIQTIRKTMLLLLCTGMVVCAGISFYKSRHIKEPVVLSPGAREVKTLGQYFSGIKGSINDSNVYIAEGEKPGCSLLVLGGTHPEEPAGRRASW